jgi:hexaprenyl-diphosphate synthase
MSHILSKSISRISLNIRSQSSRSSLISIKQRSFNNKTTKLAWSEAVQKAESLVNPTSKPLIDFKQIVQDDLSLLNQNIKEILSSGHPVLNTIAQYHFNVGGKHIRPIIVLLLSQATSIAAKKAGNPTLVDIDQPIDQKFTLSGSRWKDDYNAHGKPNSEQLVSKCPEGCTILPSQRRLAELAEVIHTASLFHDDVIDNSDLRRNAPSVNAQFGNKMAILGGDFLLARASMSLARLRNVQVVELMSTVIANLVEGELLQIKDALPTEHCDTNGPNDQVFEYYLEKTYLKTASLIANSCRGAAVLGNTTDEINEIAYEYGKNLGMAFQVILFS